MLKYRNQPQVVDGLKFASKKEARRWAELKLLERAGEIRSLEDHPKYQIVINGKHVCTYEADASYIRNADDVQVIEDVKSAITRINPVYRIKNKLMEAVYGIHVTEV